METKQAKTKVVVSALAVAVLVLFSLIGRASNPEPNQPPEPAIKTTEEVEPGTQVGFVTTLDGRVGIGTAGPLYPLSIKAPDSTTKQLFLEQDNAQHGWTLYADRHTGDLAFYRSTDGSDFERVRFDINGNVGIGTEGPTELLEIYKDNADSLIRFHDPGDAEFKVGIDMDDASPSTRVFRIAPTPGDLDPEGTANGITVTWADGNVGIGTTEPGTKLAVNGNVRVGIVTDDDGSTEGYGDFLFFSGGDDWPSVNSDNTDPLWIARYNVDPDKSELRINIGDNGNGGDSGGDQLSIGWTDGNGNWHPRMTVLSTGNVGIGTTGPKSKLHVTGLDEYEDNAAAKAAGLTPGAIYRTGDLLKVVH